MVGVQREHLRREARAYGDRHARLHCAGAGDAQLDFAVRNGHRRCRVRAQQQPSAHGCGDGDAE
jgi:hypothetical protein